MNMFLVQMCVRLCVFIAQEDVIFRSAATYLMPFSLLLASVLVFYRILIIFFRFLPFAWLLHSVVYGRFTSETITLYILLG